MNKPAFNPNQPFEVVDKPAFDPNQPFQVNDQQSGSESFLGSAWNQAKDQVSNTPMGLIGKAGINAYQGIQKGADILGEKVATGLAGEGLPTNLNMFLPKNKIKTSPEVAAGIGTAVQMAPDILTSIGTSELEPLKAPRILSKPISKIGRLFAGGVEKLTGIPEKSTVSAFTKPTSLFTAPTQKEVAAAYAKSEFPEMAQNIDDIIQKGTSSSTSVIKRGAQAIRNFVEKGVEDAKSILEGRQGLDKQMAQLENQIKLSKGPGKTALQNAYNAKLNLRQTFNRALDKMAPKLREADALASERFEVAPFREFTLPGKINLFSPEGILRSVPGLPTAVGTTVSGAGAVGKGISEAVSKTPMLSGAIISKTLTKSKAAEFLDQVERENPELTGKELKEKAREKAKQAGYKWPTSSTK